MRQSRKRRKSGQSGHPVMTMVEETARKYRPED
jgi:hypothetical protein